MREDHDSFNGDVSITNAVDGRRHDNRGLHACLKAGMSPTELGRALAVRLLLNAHLFVAVDVLL